MRKVVEIADPLPALSEEQMEQLVAVKEIEPDLADIPSAPAMNWAQARRFHRIPKTPISIRIDADVLNWLRRRSERYQVEINSILRRAMEAEVHT